MRESAHSTSITIHIICRYIIYVNIDKTNHNHISCQSMFTDIYSISSPLIPYCCPLLNISLSQLYNTNCDSLGRGLSTRRVGTEFYFKFCFFLQRLTSYEFFYNSFTGCKQYILFLLGYALVYLWRVGLVWQRVINSSFIAPI